jgi:hypothetical protein
MSNIQSIISLVESTPKTEFMSAIQSMSSNSLQVGGSHYEAEYQHWDFVEDAKLSWPEGCATKYLTRVFKKNGLQDFHKSLHYLFKMIQSVSTETYEDRRVSIEKRVPLYLRFFFAQKLNEPNTDSKASLQNIFWALANWNTVYDLRQVFLLILDLSRAVYESPATPAVDPNEGGPTSSYVDQDRQAKNVQLAVANLVSQARSILPVAVYVDVLEHVRRDRSSELDLSVCQSDPPFCQDYSEAGLKIDLAMHHLAESIPNHQDLRTEIAMTCLEDGYLSTMAWRALRKKQPPDVVPILVAAAAKNGVTFESLGEYLNGPTVP